MTSQQRADILLAIHQTNRGNNVMSLSYYDANIKPHLIAAHEYAYRTAREFARMPARPAFFTLAEDELDKAEAEAKRILEVIQSAKAQYAEKPLEAGRAA